MPSSPPEDGPLRTLIQSYDQAYEALARGDLERVAERVRAAQALIASLPGDADVALARQAHGRLQTAVVAARATIERELAQVRRGRKILQGYGPRPDHLGRRHESRG